MHYLNITVILLVCIAFATIKDLALEISVESTVDTVPALCRQSVLRFYYMLFGTPCYPPIYPFPFISFLNIPSLFPQPRVAQENNKMRLIWSQPNEYDLISGKSFLLLVCFIVVFFPDL